LVDVFIRGLDRSSFLAIKEARQIG